MADFLDQNSLPQPEQAAASNPNLIPGVLVGGVFWYVEHPITAATIAGRKAKRLTHAAIDGSVVIVAVLALLAFGISMAGRPTAEIFDLARWLQPDAGMIGLWVAILCAQFLFFRSVSAKSQVLSVPVAQEGVTTQVQTIASLDVASKRHNALAVVNPEAMDALEQGFELAVQAGHASVSPVHLFAGVFSTKAVGLLFMRLGITFDQIKDPIRRRMSGIPKGTTTFGFNAQQIVAAAFADAVTHKRQAVSAIELFTAIYESDDFIRELLFSVGVDEEQVRNVIAWVRINDQLRERYELFRKAAAFKPKKGMNRAYTAVATPFLDRVSQDVTRSAALGHLPMLIDRNREMSNLLRAIEGGRQSVVLVGPPGVGKWSMISGLAERMVDESVPPVLQDKRLVRLDVPVIVSSEGGSGAQERLLYALHEVGASGNIILVIENIDQLVATGAGGVDLASVLAGELEKRYTFVIATTTPQGYTNVVERSVLASKLQKVDIAEPERNDAIQVLESKIGAIENKHHVIFTYAAVAALVDLSMRYVHDAYLPEKAVILAEEIALEVARAGGEWPRVQKEDVARIVSEKTRVPVTEVTKDESAKLLELEERMHERIIGQEEAVKAVASALRRARAELRAENRPIANFLFLGPTGVGKTELAKTTAEVYFGSEDAMLRFDMSEYQEQASVERLIGAAGQGGLLTEAVRKQPFALLLLDELEKAHPDILNLFLQVMDDGRLTDGAGRTVDFTNVILIATSNAGTQFIQDSVAQNMPVEQIKTRLLEEELRQVYRPEFLNRFDGVIVFKPLTQDDVVSIAYLMIQKVASRLAAKGITFNASDAAVHELAQKGFDPKFGARPLRRVVQETVDNAIADILLRGQVGRRDTLVLEPGGQVRVEKAAEL